MAHTVAPITTKTINAAPGSTVTFKVVVEGATDPGPTPAGSGVINVEYNGSVVSAPVQIQYEANVPGPPSATIDLSGATGITASVGTALGLGVGRYEIPITLTVD